MRACTDPYVNGFFFFSVNYVCCILGLENYLPISQVNKAGPVDFFVIIRVNEIGSIELVGHWLHKNPFRSLLHQG